MQCLTYFVLIKFLLKFIGGENLYDLLPRSCAFASCEASEGPNCFPGVLVTSSTTDFRVFLNEY